MTQWRLQDAQNSFAAVVDAAVNGDPQYVTDKGRPAVVILATAEYERLCKLDRKVSASSKEGRPTHRNVLLDIPRSDEDLFERITWDTPPIDFEDVDVPD